MTGKMCNNHGVRVHGDMLTPDQKTIAHTFNDNGYITSYVGKWHLASTVSDQGSGGEHWVHPLMRGGFENWYGFDVSNHYYNTAYSNGFMADRHDIKTHQTDGLTDLTIRYLNDVAKNSKKPWFHVVSYEAPHGGKGQGTEKCEEYPAPKRFEDRYTAEKIVLRENADLSQQDEIRAKACGYYALTEHLDDSVGRILEFLEENDMANNTIVMFFSDHGEMLGSHGLYQKCVALEESIGIPLIIKLPKHQAKTAVMKTVIDGSDLYPTTAGLCGIDLQEKTDGIDLSGQIKSGDYHEKSALVQWMGQSRYHWGDFEYRALRTVQYSYCVGKYSDGGEGFDKSARPHTNFLYDLEKDPYQLDNLINKPEFAALKKDLHSELLAKMARCGDEAEFVK